MPGNLRSGNGTKVPEQEGTTILCKPVLFGQRRASFGLTRGNGTMLKSAGHLRSVLLETSSMCALKKPGMPQSEGDMVVKLELQAHKSRADRAEPRGCQSWAVSSLDGCCTGLAFCSKPEMGPQ